MAIPPPRVSPAIPVCDMTPPVVARPNAWVAASNSRHTRPALACPPRLLGRPGAPSSERGQSPRRRRRRWCRRRYVRRHAPRRGSRARARSGTRGHIARAGAPCDACGPPDDRAGQVWSLVRVQLAARAFAGQVISTSRVTGTFRRVRSVTGQCVSAHSTISRSLATSPLADPRLTRTLTDKGPAGI